MRTFKPTENFLIELRERLSAVTRRDLICPQVDRIILGPAVEMDRGYCTHCEAEDLAIGFLLPGYGYVCHHCGFYLVVQGLVGRMFRLEERLENSVPLEGANVVPPPVPDVFAMVPDFSIPRPNPSPGMIQENGPTGLPRVVECTCPSHTSDSLLVEVSSKCPLHGSVTGLELTPIENKAAATPKPDFGSTTLNVTRSEPGGHTPLPAKPALKLTQMRSYNSVPAGTIMRIPIKPTGDRPNVPVTANTFLEEDHDLVRPTNVRHRKVSSEQFVPSPGHIIERPETDLSKLPEDEQEIYRGYDSGRMVIGSASDVRRYETTMGDPKIMEALRALDDADEDMVAQEELIRKGRAMRGFGEHPSFDNPNPSPVRDKDGVRHVRLTDPAAVKAREDKEAGISQFEPLEPIED